MDLTKFDLIKKDLLVGYNKDDVDVSLKAEQPFDKKTVNYSNWKEWFNEYTLTAVYRRNRKERYGIEVVAHPIESKVVGTGLLEYRYSDASSTKLKVDTELNLTLLIKTVLTNKLALSFGAQVPLKSRLIKNRFGLRFDFNV